MSNINVESYIEQLRQRLPYVLPVPVSTIKVLHKKRDFGGIVRLIRSTMNVGVDLTLHWTSGPPPRGLERANAWISLPEKMPYYGTPEFKQMRMDIFILKSFRDKSDYEEFAITVAHELSHVVLESIHHPLRHEEKGVDLTAMLLGFSHLYRKAAHVIKRVGYNQYREERLGYLTPTELNCACKILVPPKLLFRIKAVNFARQFPLLVTVLPLALLIWAGVTINDRWTLHQSVLSEAARIKRSLPVQVNDTVTMIDVQPGITSLTRVFQLTRPPKDQSYFTAAVRRNICAAEMRNIAKGISYINEYRLGYGDFNLKVDVSSCP